MKTSLGTSLVMHTLVLSWALLSLSAPASFEVAPVDALPVDIVPVESITQTQKGEQNAPKTEKPAPKETKNQKVVENAENAGDNDIDLKNPPTPAKRPVETEVAAAPPKVEKPLPNPTNENNQVKDIAPEETVEKPQEVAALPTPKPEITPPTPKPEPQPEPKPVEKQAEEIPLPDAAPLPAARPKPEPPKPQEAKPAEKPAEQKPDTKATEKTPDKKVSDKKQEVAKAASSQQSDFNANEIAALLNKQESAGGGAKRSTEVASRGDKKTIGVGLSATEIDSVKGQIQGNWSLVAGLTGVQEVRVKIRVQLDPSGNIVGQPEVTATGGPEGTRRAVESSTRRALFKSAPLKNLPPEKYEGEKGWNVLVLNFDPSEFAL